MLFRLIAPFIAVLLTSPVHAAPTDALLDALGAPRMVEIMREEGLAYGEELASDMLPGGSDPGWEAIVSEIYDTDRMREVVAQGFAEDLGDTDVTGLLDFFEGATGRRIVALEVSAREAMVDPDVEEAARAAFRAIEERDDPQLRSIERFVTANDLVEENVVGALNASFAFYKGLMQGGALDMSETEMLADVWSQEDETRSETREWLYAFMLLAYGPLEQDVVSQYADLSETPEGKAMNRALFAGFNAMYEDISFALGLAIARQMQGQDL